MKYKTSAEQEDKTATELDDIFYESIREFNAAELAVRDERELCRLDRRFCYVSGAQYEGKTGEQFETKPKYEVNKIASAVTKTVGEYRNNRITVNFKSNTGLSDTLAGQCNDVFRSDASGSNAEEAYDVAFEETCSGGIGAWRWRAVYVDEYDDENEQQKAVVEPITDAATSVYFNAGCLRADKTDAKKCWVISEIGRAEYEEQYGDNIDDWPDTIENNFDWAVNDTVRIAEYYKVVLVDHSVHVYKMQSGETERFTEEDFKNDPELRSQLKAIGAKRSRVKKVKRQRIHKYLMSGGGIIEDCGVIAGDRIPVVVCVGERAVVDRVERLRGKVRTAKDPQRIKNVITNKLVEFAAASSIEKPILTPRMLGGHQELWANDAVENYPYMLVNDIEGPDGGYLPTPPINYTRVPNVPPNLAALIGQTDADITQLLGNHQGAEQLRANVSGEAIQKVRDDIGVNDFIYVSNFSKAMKVSGEIWLGIARDIYVEEGRKLHALSADKEERFIEIGRKIQDENGAIVREFDLSRSSFDVSVDVGPSTSSKRAKTLTDIAAFMPHIQDPETLGVLTSLAAMNIEGEGIAEARSYFRSKLVKMGVLTPSKEEQEKLAKEAEGQEPDANEEYLKAAALKEQAQSQKLQAETALTAAKTEKTEAETIETLAGVDRDDAQAVKESFSDNAVSVQPL